MCTNWEWWGKNSCGHEPATNRIGATRLMPLQPARTDVTPYLALPVFTSSSFYLLYVKIASGAETGTGFWGEAEGRM